MTEQEANQKCFNKVWNHFVVNEKPLSFVQEGDQVTCSYRGPNGAKCAAGVLLADYDKSIEKKGVLHIPTQYLFKYAQRANGSLLSRMQQAHDGAAGHVLSNFCDQPIKEGLAVVADEFKLTIPESP